MVDLASFKSSIDKLDIDKLKNVSTNLDNFKSKEDRLDVDKLVHVPVDLSKLIDVVKNDVVKNDVCNSKIKNTEDKILDITNSATNASLNAKINEVKNKIPSINNLASTIALTAVENKIRNFSILVKQKLTITQKLLGLKTKLLLMMIMIDILLFTNLIS